MARETREPSPKETLIERMYMSKVKEVTQIDLGDGTSVYVCDNCGAHAPGLDQIKHYRTCRPGGSRKWANYYKQAEDSPEPRKPSVLFVDKTYVLTFGKFKGKSLSYVLSEEPSYIIWLSRTVDRLHIEEDLVSDAISRVAVEQATAEVMLPENWR